MNKNVRMIGMIMLTAILIAGCGNNGGSKNGNKGNEGATASQQSDKKVNLTWVGWSGSDKPSDAIIGGMIDNWNKTNPNTTAAWLGWPWDQALQQIMVRNTSKQDMDVGQSEIGWLKALHEADAIVELSDLVGQDWLNANFEPSALGVGQIDGKQYGIPWTMSATSMVYNPALLEAAGVTKAPETIEEFEAALQQLKAYDKEIIPYGALTKSASASNDIQVWLWMFGGGVFDENGEVIINNEAGLRTMNWYKKLYDQGFIKMDISRNDARQLFTQGKMGFYEDAILAKGIVLDGGVSEDDLLKRIAPIPRPVLNAGDTPRDKMWGHLLVVFKNSPNQQEAADFIKHIVGKESATSYFVQGGLLPTMKEVIASEEVQNDPLAQQWLEITKTSRMGDTEAYSEKAALDNIIVEEFQAMLLNAKEPQKALDDAASRIKSTLKK